MLYTGPSRASSGPGVIYGNCTQGGFGGEAPKKMSVTTPLRLPENDGKTRFKTGSNIPCQGNAKYCIYESRSLFYVSNGSRQVIAVAGVASCWEQRNQNAKAAGKEKRGNGL